MKRWSSYRFVFILILVLIFNISNSLNSYSTEKKPRIAFFYSHQDRFWDDFIACMNACASNIGIELRTYCADHSRDKMINQVKEVIQSNEKPDYIMFAPFKSVGYNILKLTEKAQIQTFIVNSGLSGMSKKKLAESGLNPRYLLGEFLPGDDDAGYEQMNILLSMARKKGMHDYTNKIQAVAINGNIEDGAGFLREKGLSKAVTEPDDLTFHQIFSAPHWESAESRAMIPYIMKRYPGTRVIWCGNDGIALGVLEGCRDLNLKPGKDILVGGIDWSDFGVEAVKKGDFVLTFGGHFFDGAWALIILNDHYYGFNREESYIRLSSTMSPIMKNNLGLYAPLLVKDRNKFYRSINFRAYSKRTNRGIKKYNFSIPGIFNNVNQ